MTITPLPGVSLRRATKPRRGTWTEGDHRELVAGVRAGETTEQLHERLGRSPQAVLLRLRLLLPVDERRCPADRVLPRVAELLGDPDYDWRSALLRTPPPPPIIRHELAGLAGLDDRDLLALTFAAFNSPLQEGLLVRLRDECGRRGLAPAARDRLARAVLEGGLVASRAELDAMVSAWWEHDPAPHESRAPYEPPCSCSGPIRRSYPALDPWGPTW